jgi:hypothetical protein
LSHPFPLHKTVCILDKWVFICSFILLLLSCFWCSLLLWMSFLYFWWLKNSPYFDVVFSDLCIDFCCKVSGFAVIAWSSAESGGFISLFFVVSALYIFCVPFWTYLVYVVSGSWGKTTCTCPFINSSWLCHFVVLSQVISLCCKGKVTCEGKHCASPSLFLWRGALLRVTTSDNQLTEVMVTSSQPAWEHFRCLCKLAPHSLSAGTWTRPGKPV